MCERISRSRRSTRKIGGCALKAKSKTGEIDYSGPVLAGGRLIVTGSNGVVINIDPATGSFQSQTNVGAGVSLSPVVANSTLYVYDDNGRLSAYR